MASSSVKYSRTVTGSPADFSSWKKEVNMAGTIPSPRKRGEGGAAPAGRELLGVRREVSFEPRSVATKPKRFSTSSGTRRLSASSGMCCRCMQISWSALRMRNSTNLSSIRPQKDPGLVAWKAAPGSAVSVPVRPPRRAWSKYMVASIVVARANSALAWEDHAGCP